MDTLQKSELRLFRKLSSPEKIQKYLDDLPYNKEKEGETCYSPHLVIRHNTAHCFEGAVFAAAALRVMGRPPLILDLAALRDVDHVIAVYRTNASTRRGLSAGRSVFLILILPFVVRPPFRCSVKIPAITMTEEDADYGSHQTQNTENRRRGNGDGRSAARVCWRDWPRRSCHVFL